jgi:flavin-dependent dehydrogenase
MPSGTDRVIVIGAGIAGLTTARVLADRVAEVIVLDRDELPDRAEPGKACLKGATPMRY